MRKFILPFAAFLITAACNTTDTNSQKSRSVQGKWNNTAQVRGKQSVFTANFRTDGTYVGSLDGKVLVDGGSYKQHGDTIDFIDPVCNAAYTGQYHVKFYGDSLKFTLISDSCTLRREGTDGVRFQKQAS